MKNIINTNKKLWFPTLFLFGLISIFSVNLGASTENATKRVSILQLIEHPALDATRQGIIDELKTQSIQIDFQSAQGNPALAAQIAQKYTSTSPNLMVGIATIAAQALVGADHKRLIPIVFSSVTDPKGAKLVKNFSKPEGIVTGVSNYVDPSLQFNLFKKIIPNLKHIGIIYNPGEANSIALNEQMKKVAEKQGLRLSFASANTSADVPQAALNLNTAVEAIFINNDNTALSAFDSIVKISTKNKIPVFCSDIEMLSRGALAVLGPDQYEVGRQTGKMILSILAGKPIKEIPVGFPNKTEIKINRAQALKLKIVIPEGL